MKLDPIIAGSIGTFMIVLDHIIISLFHCNFFGNEFLSFYFRLLLCFFGYLLIMWSYYIIFNERKEERKPIREVPNLTDEEILEKEMSRDNKVLEKILKINRTERSVIQKKIVKLFLDQKNYIKMLKK